MSRHVLSKTLFAHRAPSVLDPPTGDYYLPHHALEEHLLGGQSRTTMVVSH